MDYVPYVLGIAHAPGFPLYMIAGFLVSHGVPAGSVAFRMSALSACAMAAAALAVMTIVEEAWNDRTAAATAGVLFAIGAVAWGVATRADVHALLCCTAAWSLAKALRWQRTGAERDLYAASALLGAAVAIHPVALTLAPAAIVLVVARLHETPSRRLAIAVAICAACAVVPYAYLPARDPALRTIAGIAAYMSASDPRVVWNGANAGFALRQLTAQDSCALLLSVAGALRWWLRNRASTAAILLFAAAPAFFGTHFDESDPSRYFLCAALAASVFAGAAISGARALLPRIAAFGTALAAAAALVASGFHFFAQPADHRARLETDAVVRATPDHALVLTTWTLAPALRYRERIESSIGRRRIIGAWYGDADGRIGDLMRSGPVYVSGVPEGDIAGYHLQRVNAATELYRVVANR